MLVCPLCARQYADDFGDRCPNDGSLLYAGGAVSERVESTLRPGARVAGKYELLEEMPRRGGAGRTFLAWQGNLQRKVELRILPSDTFARPSDHARFQREVATWGRLRSDHLVRLYDSGFTETNAPYMALERVEGGTLGDLLRRQGPLPFALVERAAEQALDGLIAAHEAHVLHRDLTPDALLVTSRSDGSPFIRLTGFGLAKHMGEGEDDPTAITMTGQVIGNPVYMAPETILQGLLEPRTDLYALGVTLYELLTGRRPHPGASLSEMLAAHVKGVPEPLQKYRPDVPEHLRRFISRLISRAPDDRPASARVALQALVGDVSAWPDAPPDVELPPGLGRKNEILRGAFRGALIGGAVLALGVGIWWLVR